MNRQELLNDADFVLIVKTAKSEKAILCAAGALCGGVLTAFLGAVLLVLSWGLGASENGATLRASGTVALCLTIPLLLLGGVCLDLAEDAENAARQAKAPTVSPGESRGQSALMLAVSAIFLARLS